MMNIISRLFIVLCIGCLQACSQTPTAAENSQTNAVVASTEKQSADTVIASASEADEDLDDSDVDLSLTNGLSDPIEPFNRLMWDINYDYVDPYIYKPVAVSYVDWVPDFIRAGIGNFLANLDEPATAVNNALMGEGENSFKHFGRFVINTIFGGLGLVDVADFMDLAPDEGREFGDVLGYYGLGYGPYFMIPGYGPLSVRYLVGGIVDNLYLPLSFFNVWELLGKRVIESLEPRVEMIPSEPMLDNSPDPYLFVRDLYIQHSNRTSGIEVREEEDLEDLLDEE